MDFTSVCYIWIGRGGPMGDDGLWLSGQNTIDAEETDRVLSTQFIQRRNLLVKHLHYYRQKGAITE